MNEWILIIAVLTSGGWVENKVDREFKDLGVAKQHRAERICKNKAYRINNGGILGSSDYFLRAYCREVKPNTKAGGAG